MSDKKNVIGKVDTGNVVDKVVNEIINHIISGEYQANEKLPNEFELMESLNVSRGSLREAMKVLSAIGVVEIKRGDGTYVNSQPDTGLFDKLVYSMIGSTSSKMELLELRKIMDETALYYAMSKIDDNKVKRLEENIALMEKCIEEKNVPEAVKVDYEFHLMIAKACDNNYFYHIIKGIYSIFEKLMYESTVYEDKAPKSVYYHKKMLECLKNKDIMSIPNVIEESLETWKKVCN